MSHVKLMTIKELWRFSLTMRNGHENHPMSDVLSLTCECQVLQLQRIDGGKHASSTIIYELHLILGFISDFFFIIFVLNFKL